MSEWLKVMKGVKQVRIILPYDMDWANDNITLLDLAAKKADYNKHSDEKKMKLDISLKQTVKQFVHTSIVGYIAVSKWTQSSIASWVS